MHERERLKNWDNDAFGNSVAIGTSSKLAISHLKILIVEGVYTMGIHQLVIRRRAEAGKELTLSRNAVAAAETRAVLDRNHDWMLKQMAEAARPKKSKASR